MRILSGLIRVLGGLAGITILLFLYNGIFVEGKGILPMSSGNGYYGPVIVPMSLYISIALIGYAIGGQKVLRKFAPGMSDKRNEASKNNEK